MEVDQEPDSVPVAELTGKALDQKAEEKRKSLEQLIPACFDSSNANKITLDHGLRLFAKSGTAENSRNGIVEETYSEIEFMFVAVIAFSFSLNGEDWSRGENRNSAKMGIEGG